MGRLVRSICWPAIAACCAVVCLAPYSLADIIVLKNGRRIVASNVKEAGEKISGETSAGSITVPASIVDHIEREAGGVSPVETLRLSRPQTANNPSASAQTTEDPAFLQQAGREAASGDAAAAARAAQLEAAAGGAEFARGNMDEALRHAERALGYEPESLALLLDAAYIRLRRAEYGPALDYLQRARKVAPDSVEVAKLAGWAYYGQNRLAPAVEEWRRAQKIQPDDEVAAALAKAERDLEAEREFREDGSEHFVLKYSGTAAPELARAILRQLEADFLSISATLNYDPSERIGVLLYTNQAFADITHAPSWVGALNDGRIRIPVQGLTSVTPELARVLRHELAHSIVGGKTRGRCPVWLQEGVAQWMDGSELSPGGAAKLLALFDRHQDPSLLLLEGSWMKFDQGFAGNAYGWSLAVVQSVARAGGPTDIARLLEYVAVESDTETAVRSSLHLDYSGLAAFAADDLRKNYGH